MKRNGFKTRGKPLKASKPMRQVSKKRQAEGQTAAIKAKPKRLTPAQANAEGKPCQLQLPGCRCDPIYTVLCHARRFGWGGMSVKPPDYLGYFGCDLCHEKQERYHPDCSDGDLMRAMGNTLKIQFADGVFSEGNTKP